MFKTVLFPIDQSRETQAAAETVVNLVKTYNSRLILLSVVEKSPADSSTSSEDMMKSSEAVAKLLESAQDLFASAGIQAEIVEREGIPSFTICDVADELRVDLIIMGCRGLGLTQEGAKESVTSRVINLAPCPVLVIP